MLTDIFARRYADVKIWKQFTSSESRLIVQAFKIVSEQICPYYIDGKESPLGKNDWTTLHDRISMELGVQSLSPLAYSYPSTWNGNPYTVTGLWTMNTVCENWIHKAFDGQYSADEFIKERLSLLELAFRLKGERVAEENSQLPAAIRDADIRSYRKTDPGIRLPGKLSNSLRASNAKLNQEFRSAVDELNARFVQSGSPLNYHNGFFQLSEDVLVAREIETAFWDLVASPKWKTVDADMKEALDRRDSLARDSAFPASKALESAIKIVSKEKGWTTGREKGAHNFIDNLASKSNGFIAPWEASMLKMFFTEVRNPLGHGPGENEAPSLTKQQTDWAIQNCMIWISSLIRRL